MASSPVGTDHDVVRLALQGHLDPAGHGGLVLHDHDRAGHSAADHSPMRPAAPGGRLAARSAALLRFRLAPQRTTVVRPCPDASLEDPIRTAWKCRSASNARTVTGKHTKRLRAAGVVPGVVFGKKAGSVPVQLDAKALDQLYREAGRTSVVRISVDGGETNSAVIKSIQRHPLTGRALHVDFFALDLTAEMTVDIPLVFVGEPPAVEATGGFLLTSLDHLQVKALPSDLPHELTSTSPPLVDLESAIHVSDLSVAENVTVLNDPDELVAQRHAAARRGGAGAGRGRGRGGCRRRGGCRGRRGRRRRGLPPRAAPATRSPELSLFGPRRTAASGMSRIGRGSSAPRPETRRSQDAGQPARPSLGMRAPRCAITRPRDLPVARSHPPGHALDSLVTTGVRIP